MINSELKYDKNLTNILIKTGIDDIFDKQSGVGLDNILLKYAYKFMTIDNGFKNFQIVTNVNDIGITKNDYNFQDIVDNVPEQAIVWLEIPETAEIITKGQKGNLFMLTAPLWDKENSIRPIPMIALFLNPLTNIPWLRYYDGKGGDTFWYPLYRYKASTSLTGPFTGRFDVWQYGNVIWLSATITSNAIISNAPIVIGTLPSILAPDYSFSNIVETPTGLAVLILDAGKVLIRKASGSEDVPSGSTLYLNTSWMAKADYS